MAAFEAQGRAEHLGAAGRTVLIRCACGRRAHVARARWRRRLVHVCDGCRGVIVYDSFLIVGAEQAPAFMAEVVEMSEEREAAREAVERELLRFAREFGRWPARAWPPEVVCFMRAVAPQLGLLGVAVTAGAGETEGDEDEDDDERA